MPDPKLTIITATRVAAADFMTKTVLGRCLHRLRSDPRIEVRVAVENTAGLPATYNKNIAEENRGNILVFMHDDVWIDDFHVYERLTDALNVFDIVGVVGNVRRLPRQVGWCLVTEAPFARDDSRYLSGVIGHGDPVAGALSRYGAPGRGCELLDGVFLAARCETLLDAGVRFDERFDFDFYDLDFCRSAIAAKLKCGTWPIAVTHQSAGDFGPRWLEALAVYREKWGE